MNEDSRISKAVGLGALGKSATSKWRRNNPEKALLQHLKDTAKQKEKRHAVGERSETQTKCVECGAVYERADAHIRGYRIFKGNKGYRCICDECA